MASSRVTNDALSVLSLLIHIVQCSSAVVVLGIAAWAVQDTKSTTVIYSLVIAVLTPAIYAIALTISCITRRRKGHFLPVLIFDVAFSYLWLTAFILLAREFNHIGCRVVLWNGETVCSRNFVTLISCIIEFTFMYSTKGVEYRDEMENVRESEDRLGGLSRNLRNFGIMP
ncbi:hypothetical protein ETB97_007081 [Aspergillus alliaceus]|uniref:MARVEL domain-containing protein n=1 Tax=Petromyces alliaceus TaxID=209559 RepID=A0A8H6E2Y5_PETAA|nr:hypothetical protein ETB97_007081 [Aspergillus burnettii]